MPQWRLWLRLVCDSYVASYLRVKQIALFVEQLTTFINMAMGHNGLDQIFFLLPASRSSPAREKRYCVHPLEGLSPRNFSLLTYTAELFQENVSTIQ
jgi:hypothetical protein